MEKDWICIYTTNKAFEAEIIKSMMEEEGIEVVLLNKQDSSYLVIGEIEIYVNAVDVIRAKYLINNSEL